MKRKLFVALAVILVSGPLAGSARAGTTNQPDGLIAKKGSFAYVGRNIYNISGLNQTITRNKGLGEVAHYTIEFQNDGPDFGDFQTITGCKADTGWSAKYFDSSGDVSKSIKNGTYESPFINVGSSFSLSLDLTITSASVAAVHCLVSAESNSAGLRDVVGADLVLQ